MMIKTKTGCVFKGNGRTGCFMLHPMSCSMKGNGLSREVEKKINELVIKNPRKNNIRLIV